MQDTSHLIAIMDRISRERDRMNQARTTKEREYRAHRIMMDQRELDAEYKHLGMAPTTELADMSGDDLLAELMA